MTATLTPDQLQALAAGSERPLRLTDPHTQREYVLLSADEYERLLAIEALDDSDFDPREAYPFIDRIMADDDANDPHLDGFQEGHGKEFP